MTEPIPDLCLPDAWHDRYELERERRQAAEYVLRDSVAVGCCGEHCKAWENAREYLASIGENQ